MKKVLLLIAVSTLALNSQSQVLKRLADRAKQKLENKAGEKVDKGIDNATDGTKKEKDSKKSSDAGNNSNNNSGAPNDNSTSNNTNNSSSNSNAEVSANEPASLKTYSKYDFIPGDKIIVTENFSQDAIGDFPAKWNTNSSGEVVNIDGHEGKWLKINKAGAFQPEYITSLPDNFTLEYDLGVNTDFSFYSSEFYLTFANMEKPESEFSNWGQYARWNNKHAVRFNIHPMDAGAKNGMSRIITSNDGNSILDNTVSVHEFFAKGKNFSHISMWRQNQRLRVYVNGEKIWDLPKAFGQGATYNGVIFGTGAFHNDNDFYVINNLRLAVGAPDTRNKLITEGKFVTHGILFDVNSDKIKPESYGTIKDIASVLTENSSVRVKVIGHTDSDGDDKSNLDLSKRRADAVKSALIKEFSIDGSRIETDGKGETQPVDKANTPVAKANNRRVEFVKL